MDDPEASARDEDVVPLRRREPAAVERWFLRYADPLYTFAFYRVGRDAEAAAEVVQETFTTALRKIRDYDPGRGSMHAWLTYTARNCIRRVLRQHRDLRTQSRAWQEIDRKLQGAWSELDRSLLPDEVVEREETANMVRAALSNLPEHYREALTEHYCRQRSLEQIAGSRGTSAGAVKSLLHRARLAFKVAFETITDSVEQRPPVGREAP
jgi:RNA polymerase sigma-70 factor (ECF subfamily)